MSFLVSTWLHLLACFLASYSQPIAAQKNPSGSEGLAGTIEICSKWGEGTARRSGDPRLNCGSLQEGPPPPAALPHQSNFCRSAALLACSQAIREMKCEEAVEQARTLGRCPGPSNTEEMECCVACLLGLALGSGASQCDPGEARFGPLREAAFLSCCQDTPVSTTSSTTSTDKKEGGERERKRNVCEELAGELCAHTCSPTVDSYRCTCRPGFRLMSDGKSCTPEPLRCDECSHGCEKTGGGEVVCRCPPGLRLASDNTTCQSGKDSQVERKSACPRGFYQLSNETNICHDVDECSKGSDTCESGRELCVNTIGSFICSPKPTSPPEPICRRGYRYSPSLRKCIDVDECVEGGRDDPACDSSQTCRNTPGSFSCSCRPGFREDPLTLGCIDINECQQSLHNCAQYQRCDNTIGSFVCVRDINCGTGYTLNHHSGKCEDDNECELGTDTCRFLGNEWECVNTKGSFRCVKKGTGGCSGVGCEAVGGGTGCEGDRCVSPQQPLIHCPSGFLQRENTCIDINECEEGLARCKPNERCINIKGSYLCSDLLKCKPGFKLNPTKTQCIDIDECNEEEGLCNHLCDNMWGTFRCRCRPGYKLHSDNRTCIDINECEVGVRCQGFCMNQQGSYSCGCPPGYKLAANKHFCIDINECESPEKVCQEENNEICINLSGSYRCNVVVCPSGYHRDGNRRTRCQRDNLNCLVDDLPCKKQPATYTYNFITMVSNYTMPRTGFVKLFTVESKWGSTSPDFKLDLIQARVPPGVMAARRSDFNLNKQYGRATIELLKPLLGPQEIQLELRTEFYNNELFLGVSVFAIEIYVSQYTF